MEGKRSPAERLVHDAVGVTGFEPAAFRSRTERSARLSYTPKQHGQKSNESGFLGKENSRTTARWHAAWESNPARTDLESIRVTRPPGRKTRTRCGRGCSFTRRTLGQRPAKNDREARSFTAVSGSKITIELRPVVHGRGSLTGTRCRRAANATTSKPVSCSWTISRGAAERIRTSAIDLRRIASRSSERRHDLTKCP